VARTQQARETARRLVRRDDLEAARAQQPELLVAPVDPLPPRPDQHVLDLSEAHRGQHRDRIAVPQQPLHVGHRGFAGEARHEGLGVDDRHCQPFRS
jgi:hypothetical protein